MPGIGFAEMQEMQKALQERYKDKWEPLSPAAARDKLLWMMAEAGEAAEIIKKNGDGAIMENGCVRHHFIEELCDVMMYFNEVALCFGIKPEDLSEIYVEKHIKNMDRWA